MDNKKKLAADILEKVGGRENVISAYHCMTRLRLSLKNQSAVNEDQVKEIPGVLGAQFREGIFQVIIGTTVHEVYEEFAQLAGLKEEAPIDENLDLPQKKAITPKSIGAGIINTFSNAMGPLVPLFVTLGMVNTLAILIGPTMLNLVSDSSDLYNNFYQAGQAIIYFLPIFVAITASRHFKANTFISVALACLMVYPEIVTLLAADTGYTIYGIKAINISYDSQILPVILTVWVQSYVEKLVNRIVPDALKVILCGLLTVLIMMPLEFLVLGPIGYELGSLLVNAVIGLYSAAGPVETCLVCAFIPFLTAFGIGRPIFFACMAILFQAGSESAYMPFAMAVNNFTIMGIAFGYFLKAKNANRRQVGISCFVSAVLGGVSEPTLFGIILPDKNTYLPVILAGGVSGLLAGILKLSYYQFGPSNILSVIGFISDTSSQNLINGIIVCAAAFAVALVSMIVLYKPSDR